MTEIYKDIEGYEGFYQVSNLGNVKSLGRNGRGCSTTDKILKPMSNGRGYIYYSLLKEKKRRNFYGHRLVMDAFCQKDDNMPDVNHINGIKDDNRLCNLERCSKKMNMIHASNSGLLRTGEKSHFSKLLESDIKKIKILWANGVKADIICMAFSISKAQVSRVVNNKNWRHAQK